MQTSTHFFDKESLFLQLLDKRSDNYRRNDDLDALLDELTQLLSPVETIIEEELTQPSLPPLFLLGNPRSGTTLFMQFLAASGAFAVPTNFLSRFYYAPGLGARLQLLLTDRRYDYKNELSDLRGDDAFSSRLGKTSGTLAPSEFFHFWRRFLPNYDPQFLDVEQCQKVDIHGLRKGVAAIEHVFGKPFAAKAIILQYNVPLLQQIFGNGLMIYLDRDPLFVMQSILLAREEFYNDRSIWWSVRPREYAWLKGLDLYQQIAGQVYFTQQSIELEFAQLPPTQRLKIDYANFCRAPEETFEQLQKKYFALGHRIDCTYKGPSEFTSSNEIRISTEDIDRLMSAYREFANGTEYPGSC